MLSPSATYRFHVMPLPYDRALKPSRGASFRRTVPRRSREEELATRAQIVERAMTVASTEGLEGLTIGRLADDVGMSKSGLIGHFQTKEGLQVAALEEAG